MLSEIKGLASRSAVYSIGNVLLKVIGFLLLPIYTRLLTPADYGILAVTGVVSAIVGIVSSLSLHGFVSPLYFSTTDPQERKSGIGTLFVAVLFIGGVFVLLIDQVGVFLFTMIFRDVPFHPYIRLAIWTAYFTSWGLIPLRLLQTQERSGVYILFTLSGSLLQIGLALWFVVYLRQGVGGMLTGYLLAALIMVIPYIGLALRNLRPSFKANVLQQALAFSLPLVPHALSSWILELSDRTILQWYVPLDQLGIYTLAYSFGMLLNLVAYAMNTAWVPYLFRIDANESEKAAPRLGQMGTYFALVLCLVALFLGLAAQPVMTVLTPPSYHAAGEIAPWIVAGLLLSGLYYFPASYLFLRRRTTIIPRITIIASVVNIGLNFWLIPFYGVIAAAWTTLFSYGIMLVLTWWFAFEAYPVVYEYKRLTVLFFVTLTLWVTGNGLPWPMLWFEVVGKVGILFLFPVVISLCGFISEAEKRQIRSFCMTARIRLTEKSN